MKQPYLPLPPFSNCCVAIIGLGYVGLPLAVEFAKKQNCLRTGSQLQRRVIGFEISRRRLTELRSGHDRTNEITREDLINAVNLEFTDNIEKLAEADVYIVTVPTPIDQAKRPDLEPLKSASETVGKALRVRAVKHGSTTPIVIFESTVYPGATEEICVPILEKYSQLAFNSDFLCGYSPERINPGDRDHRLTTITKVTSGSTAASSQWIDNLYGSIIKAGTHRASSLKVAEAAKVIENTQRDLNIALVNELAIIFRELEIDTLDVLEAAGTKWNFLPFRPGLVGGHCIGVDPYYLTCKAEQLGYHPQVVLAGRRINDGMGPWIVEQLVLELARRSLVISGMEVLVLGLSFKENCPDLRNTRVVDILKALRRYGMDYLVVDPCVDPEEAFLTYGLKVYREIPTNTSWHAIILSVPHAQFTSLQLEEWSNMLSADGILFDLKGVVPRELKAFRL